MADVTERRNQILRVVCGVLIAFVASHILLTFISIPLYYQRVTSGEVPTLSLAGDVTMSNDLVAQWAAQRGMSLSEYAIYSIVLNVSIALGFMVIAALILLKARREWFHWFTALVLIFYPMGGLEEFVQVSQIGYVYVALEGILWPCYLLFLYLFPNGRAVPRWTRWPMGLFLLVHQAIQLGALLATFVDLPDEVSEVILNLSVVITFAFILIVFSQIYRYVRASTSVEKLQIKWFVAGLALYAVISIFLDGDSSQAVTQTGIAGDISEFLALFIPAAIGIGILRYRLYEIDVIIRRTLIYGVVTALLAGTYFVVVGLLQLLLSPFSGEDNDLAIIATTLVIAALFFPLRSRVQGFVDRRFYRRKYDATKTMDAFRVYLRSDVDIDSLSGRLVDVVGETMQPEGISSG